LTAVGLGSLVSDDVANIVGGVASSNPLGFAFSGTGSTYNPLETKFNSQYQGKMYTPEYYADLRSYQKNNKALNSFGSNQPFWEWQNPSVSSAMNSPVNLTINVSAQTNDGKELGKQIADQVMYIFPNR